jgi:hypothetical protein
MRSSSAPLLLLLVGFAATPAARADDAAANSDEPARPLSAVALTAAPGGGGGGGPRFVRSDDPTEPRRSAPGWRGETTELGYRWWFSRGRADLGLGFGTLVYVVRPTGSMPGLVADGAAVLASGTVLTLGMRYRTSPNSAIVADAASWRGGGQNGDAVVGKVGLEFKTAKSSLNLSFGGLGLTLPGDARMTLRVRHGGLVLGLRRSF